MQNIFITEILNNYKFLFPEIFLILCIFCNIIILFFNKNTKSETSIVISVFFIFLAIFFEIKNFDFKNFGFFDSGISFEKNLSFSFLNGMYLVTKSLTVFKLLILLALFFVHLFSLSLSSKKSFINKFGIAEISILFNFSALGAILAISARNFIFLYLALELQALSSYILVSLKRDSKISTESALKYFVLGVIASSFMLFGISLVYFVFESFSFDKIYSNIILENANLTNSNFGFSKIGMIGIFMIFCGLFFKLSSFPFHTWLADVYQGASNSVIGFLGVIPKIMAASILLCLHHYVFIGEYAEYSKKTIESFAFLSLTFGSFLAILQKNFKRFLAYSGVANSGFILICILGIFEFSFKALSIYFFGYMIGFFGLLSFAMFYWSEDSENKENYQISQMHGMAKKYNFESIMVAFCLFSIAGIPPFIGFFGKLQILISAFSHFNIVIIVTALLTSIISLIYYLGILKAMYFANYEESDKKIFPEYRKFLIFFGISTILSIVFLIF